MFIWMHFKSLPDFSKSTHSRNMRRFLVCVDFKVISHQISHWIAFVIHCFDVHLCLQLSSFWFLSDMGPLEGTLSVLNIPRDRREFFPLDWTPLGNGTGAEEVLELRTTQLSANVHPKRQQMVQTSSSKNQMEFLNLPGTVACKWSLNQGVRELSLSVSASPCACLILSFRCLSHFEHALLLLSNVCKTGVKFLDDTSL